MGLIIIIFQPNVFGGGEICASGNTLCTASVNSSKNPSTGSPSRILVP